MLPALVFLATVSLLAAFYSFAIAGPSQRRATLSERLTCAFPGAEAGSVGGAPLPGETLGRLDALVARSVGKFAFLGALARLITNAGDPFTFSQFMTLSLGLAAVGVCLGVALGFGVLPASLGALPWLYVLRRKSVRMQAFERQFPDALALLSRALRAGHSLRGGIRMVANELAPPMGTEFTKVVSEISFGRGLPTALANLQLRIDAQDLPFFVTTLLVQQETGGDLAGILDNLAELIRERQSFHGKVRALTAQSRMSANVLVAMPFVILGLMYLFNPGFIAPLWETPNGHLLGLVGGVGIVGGYALCLRLSRIEL